MKPNELPDRWEQKVRAYLDRSKHGYKTLSVADFQNDLRITFEDGSKIHFNYAFYLKADDLREVAVFTEHCGYHFFPFCMTVIELVDRNGNIIQSESALAE